MHSGGLVSRRSYRGEPVRAPFPCRQVRLPLSGATTPAHAKPALTVHSGDTVRIQTLSTCGPTERMIAEGVAPGDIPAYNADIYREVKDHGPGGHILTGPVAIEEAEPGDVLEVQILKIDIDVPFACNGFGTGRGFLPNDYPYSRRKIIPLDRDKMIGKFAPGR